MRIGGGSVEPEIQKGRIVQKCKKEHGSRKKIKKKYTRKNKKKRVYKGYGTTHKNAGDKRGPYRFTGWDRRKIEDFDYFTFKILISGL